MDVKFYILLVLSSQIKSTCGVHISGIIDANTTFFYRKLPVALSVSATIEFSVSYRKSLVRDKFPTMSILTTYPKLNIEKKCSYISFGQFHNESLHTSLRLSGYRHTRCELSGADTVNCTGKFAVQDYIPRNFYLTFGFRCDWRRIHFLQGLQYNISFTSQSNDTNGCTDYPVLGYAEVCKRFYNETSIGDESVDQIVKYFKRSIHSIALETPFLVDGTCYQHFWEVACHIVLPKCDPITQQVKHSCREMCWDFFDGCWQKIMDLLTRMDSDIRYINRHI